MKTEINKQAFKSLLERETTLRDESPEHTLDWYTYDNKVRLLKEVEALFHVSARPTTAAEVINTVESELDNLTKALHKGSKVKSKDKSPNPTDVEIDTQKSNKVDTSKGNNKASKSE